MPVPVTPVMATAAPSAAPFAPPLAVTSIEQMAARLRQSGEAGKRGAVVGSQRNVGATYSAISLARALGGEANVVLVDFAFRAPNLSVISTDPNAPGVAELVRGAASFAGVITRDQFSQVHLIATGQVGDPAALAASPELATMLEALARSYDHVVVDLGAVPDAPLDRFAPLAQNVALVVGDAAGVAARSARDRLAAAGFGEVGLLVSGVRAAAA
jgi:Mrp family chromosome partitioning ATPase